MLCCRLKIVDDPLLESKVLNVHLPSLTDLATSLPASWRGTVCTLADNSNQLPKQDWLDKFWSLVGSAWHKVPHELMHFMVVPLTDNRLASPAFCCIKATLSTVHLKALPAKTAQHLSAVGCLCMAEPLADCASCIDASEVPVITALAALPSYAARPLQQLVSIQRLGEETFKAVRSILALHIPLPQEPNPAVWDVLKQCSIFETASGDMTDFSDRTLQLLPNAAWEQSLLDVPHLVLGKPVMYHTASDVQQKLLKHSGLTSPELPNFLDELVGSIQVSGDNKAVALLLQALDQLARYTSYSPQNPDRLLVNGRVHVLSTLVDSSSKLLQALFEDGTEGEAACAEQLALLIAASLCFSCIICACRFCCKQHIWSSMPSSC